MIGHPTSQLYRSPLIERISFGVALAPYTTLEIGGSASQFVEAFTESDVVDAIEYARFHGLDIFVLGGGSNILVADSGFDGLVIKISITGREFSSPENGRVTVKVGAGEVWDDLVAECVARDLAGVECLSGIPGLVGGTPIQNVGAYGQDVSETISSVRCFDSTTNKFIDIGNHDCGFEYRKSIFNTTDKDRFIVTSVEFSLVPGSMPKIAYRDLKEMFGDDNASLKDVRDAVIRIRSEKSMVIRNDDPNRRSAGSFFKNPVLTFEEFADLEQKFPGIPKFPAENGVKIPAAWLIENAGFAKGHGHGNVGISSKHSLALINAGNATAAELTEFRDFILDTVRNKFGILLVQEPVEIGSN